MTTKKILAWHFSRDDGAFGRDPKQKVAAGYVYTAHGTLKMCKWGMHASRSAIDALAHSPGALVSRVLCWGDVIEGDCKLVCRHREHLWIADATHALRAFARKEALCFAHLWKCPSAVRKYLETGEEALRATASAAAWAAASATVLAAASAAAWAAAWAAESAAAWDVAKATASATASAAARDADSAAAWDVARDAASDRLQTRLMQLAPEGYEE